MSPHSRHWPGRPHWEDQRPQCRLVRGCPWVGNAILCFPLTRRTRQRRIGEISPRRIGDGAQYMHERRARIVIVAYAQIVLELMLGGNESLGRRIALHHKPAWRHPVGATVLRDLAAIRA